MSDDVFRKLEENVQAEFVRMVEALLFASAEPLSEQDLALRLPDNANIPQILDGLTREYSNRGIQIRNVAGKWAMRTAQDLSFLLTHEAVEQRKLSRAAQETLAIIAYHQPVTRAEIEEIRGVAVHKGTLDVLLETAWIRMRGRRRTPGRPVTYGVTESFLDHFGLNSLEDLPGLDELRGAGLLDSALPPGFSIPELMTSDELTEDEDPLDENDLLISPVDQS
ncbi:MAG: SMC-Scp complex subunit ScpB [Hyphomicrobiales bacterium]|nr:MAG: SMC-Scp complex subunit ScpB [Hyphomicrobiales bacterium]